MLNQLQNNPVRCVNMLDLILIIMPDQIINMYTVPVMSDHDAAIVHLDTTVKYARKNPRLFICTGKVRCVALKRVWICSNSHSFNLTLWEEMYKQTGYHYRMNCLISLSNTYANISLHTTVKRQIRMKK